MKNYIVYFRQSELFKVEVEAVNRKEAEELATTAFNKGSYSETGSLEVVVDSIEELEKVAKNRTSEEIE